MAESKQYGAQATWVEGLQFVARGDTNGAAIVLDGALEHGGSGSGARPMEGLLMCLAGCTAMDVISILKKKRQRVTAFHVRVQGVTAEEYPKRYVRIALEYVIRGWDVAPEAVARAIELSQTKYCGVTASLNAEIVYSFRVEQETAEEPSA